MEMASNLRPISEGLAALSAEEIGRIEAEANAGPLNPLVAQMVEDKGCWLVADCFHGELNVASGHLIGRRFGVFQALERVVEIRRGRKYDISRPLYRNYLFVYAFGLGGNVQRIRACTGVRDVLRHADGSPAIVPWNVINDLRVAENENNPAPEVHIDGRPLRRKYKGKRGQARYEADYAEWEKGAEVVRVRCWGFSKSMGTWDEPETEAEQANKSKLHKALGLSPED
jgi:hypothetical protein